ncbi:MAG TPA: pirin-like C-terminal cupin domain-containing protein [Verrucomicrobiae bacterium]|nr:pirin-like C-terminal cupin domain-containing protein [Verrucomicrobiae bacterium]
MLNVNKWRYFEGSISEEITFKPGELFKNDLNVLIIGGTSINKLISRYCPFVMNIKDEIYQSIQDYQSGRLGTTSH